MGSFKDTAYSNQRHINMKVILKMGSITAMENTLGAQGIHMKDPMKMAKSMATEYILISIDPSIKENGLGENDTEKEYKYRHKEESKRYLSKWAKGLKPKVDIHSYSFFTQNIKNIFYNPFIILELLIFVLNLTL